MRLCDEYGQRMGLSPLIFRHYSKSFLFFDSGSKLLSIKWFSSSNSSSGRYEFIECTLGKIVKTLSKDGVEWADYEKSLEVWMSNHDGFVFDDKKVFNLTWNFFVVRNDVYLAERYDPFLIYSTLGLDKIDLAMTIANEIPARSANSFWGGQPGNILKNYAYWLKDWR